MSGAADESQGFAGHGVRFFRRWLFAPLRTGAVYPSSRHLAAALAREIPAHRADGAVIVELGPGTGAVTAAILAHGVREADLVLLEYSPEFCDLLRRRFPGVRVVEGDAYEPGAAFTAALDGRPIAATVSSLPLMGRPETAREAALRLHLARMAMGAPFVQFTYAPSLPVRPERIGARVESRPWVLRNLPPARVLVYRRQAGGAGDT